jgi:hypothetical protein
LHPRIALLLALLRCRGTTWQLVRRIGAVCLLLSFAGCRMITVAPLPLAPATSTIAARPDFDFELQLTEDPGLTRKELGYLARKVDGEELARAQDAYREALLATDRFASVQPASAGQRLHCSLAVRAHRAIPETMVLVLSAGLIPDAKSERIELVATVTAPGRAATVYKVRARSHTLLWSPLIPIGLVQMVTQTGTLQQGIDALVASIAADGWLESAQPGLASR